MILDNNNRRKPEIEYPCDWQYKVISKSADAAVKAAEEAAEGFEYDITSSKVSSKGKYVSINLTVRVENEIERNLIFGKLEKDDDVVMIL